MQQDMEGQMNNQVALELGNNRLQIMQQQITIAALSQQLAAAQAQVMALTPKEEPVAEPEVKSELQQELPLDPDAPKPVRPLATDMPVAEGAK